MTLRLVLVCWLLFSAAGCASDTNNPTSPSLGTADTPGGPVSPTPPRGSLTIRGVVSESLPGGGTRPMAGVNVNAWVQTSTMGYSYMWANGVRRTDGSGRYQLNALPGSSTVVVDAWVDGNAHVQQCAAPAASMDGDATIDIQLVSRENVSASPDRVPRTPGFRFVSGVIFENTPAGKRPAQGVHVMYEAYMDTPVAHTFSDADGRYLLCGIPEQTAAEIGAGSFGRAAYATARPGQTTGIDLVLP